jgi:AcrR family transcriptional regulator
MKALAERRRPQHQRRNESKTLILDSAEAEFARKGYNGATLASVAEVAGVDTSLMRYYFGDKEKLFEEVFRRRGPIINHLRRQAFEKYEAEAGKAMTLEGVIDAFIRPGLELSIQDAGWRNYDAIIAYVNSSGGELRRLMSEVFDETAHLMLRYMRKVLPDASEEELYWGYHFLSGGFTFSLGQTGRIDAISGGRVSSHDLAAILERLPIVFAAGIRALCDRKRKKATQKPRKSR